jgi:hypothetical protein
MKKWMIGLGCGSLVLLSFIACCAGAWHLGSQKNTEDATRDYEVGNQLWAAGNKAEAVEKYRAIKTTWLDDDAKKVVDDRIKEYDRVHAREELLAADAAWRSGKREEAVAKYRAMRTDLIDLAEQETVKERIKEFEQAQAKKDLAEAHRLWEAGEKAKAAGKYRDLPLSDFEAADQDLAAKRMLEHADRQWDNGWRKDAASYYRRLPKDRPSQEEHARVAPRIQESDDIDKKIAKAEKSTHGKKVKLKEVDLYFTPAITEAEARKMVDYLDHEFKGDPDRRISAQITKEGKTYQYRVVVKKGIELDQQAADLFKGVALKLSLFVFDGENVEVHMCDEQLKTLRVVVPLLKS